MPSVRRSSMSRPATFVFWLLAVSTQLSFNHVSNMIFGAGWFVTLGLALCSMFLVLAVRTPIRRSLGLPGCLIAAALISYVAIGSGVAVVIDTEWRVEIYRYSFKVGVAVILIVASALGASAVLRQSGIEYLLIRILVIKAVVCVLILATPVLVENLYNLPPHYRHLAQNRFIGPFYGPGFAGIAACQAVVLSLFMLYGRHWGFACLVAILGSAAAVMSFSKTAILALVTVSIFFLWSSRKNVLSGRLLQAASWLTGVFIVGGLVLVIAGAEYLPITYKQFFRLEWIATFGSVEMDPRFELWPLGLSIIAESPLSGHGLLRFHHLEGGLACRGGTHGYIVLCGVHNTYLLLWGEAGIVPATLFLLFVGSLLLTYPRMPKSMATDVVTGWTIILAMDFMSYDHGPLLHWNAFLIGLMCAMTAHVAREARRPGAARAPETRPASVRTTS